MKDEAPQQKNAKAPAIPDWTGVRAGAIKLTPQDFYRLKEYMRENYGVNLENKQSLIEGRLSARLAAQGRDGFTGYLDEVLSNPEGDEMAVLVSKLTTNYTYFMREEIHYQFMRDRALPEWDARLRDKDLRTWSAGCSSGEEAYTAAMLIDEYFGQRKAQWDTTILATDISQRVLELGKLGIYNKEALTRIPQRWQQQYFEPVDNDTCRINNKLKNQVVFGQFNLMTPAFPFKRKFHIIFCRNVMIYFKRQTKEELAERFYNHLEPGGFLFIGMSETMTGIQNRFEYIQPSIYRKPLR